MRKLGVLIASWWLTAILLLALGIAYASLSFGKNPWPAWTAFVLRSPAGIVLLVGLIVNQLAISARIVFKRFSRTPPSVGDIRRMDGHIMIEVPASGATDQLASWMRSKGFSPVRDGGTLHAVRGMLSFLPGTLFRMGVVLFLAAALASATLRRSERFVLHEGESVASFGRTMTLTSVRTDLREDFLQVGEESTLRLERVSAEIRIGGRTRTVTSYAPERDGALYYRVVHLGYAQPIEVKGVRKPQKMTMDLDILPPGKNAVLSLPEDDRFLTVSLEPERTITKGILKGRQFDLRHPRYRVVVLKGKKQREANLLVLRPGEQGTSGGLRLSLGEDSVYVALEVVRDPALFWVRAGLFLTLAGLSLLFTRPFWYEKRLSAVREGEALWVGYSEEFYRKWGIARLYDWRAELTALKRP